MFSILKLTIRLRVCKTCSNEVEKLWFQFYTCKHCKALMHINNTEVIEKPHIVA